MSQPKKNDIVSVFYRGKLDNGELFKIVEKEEPQKKPLARAKGSD